MRRIQDTPLFRLLRLHQPTGIWLLLWPCWWSVALASNGNLPLQTMTLFALGATLMRAAGCIINDMTDRKFDRAVERTRTRPLASGEVSMKQASLVLLLLLLLSLVIAWALGEKVVLWSAAALPLVVVYPWMKRITWWPQAFLGLTFNWGALVGWVAVRGEIDLPALALYAAGIFWTLGYDTIYAHQDVLDDTLIGVKSTARRLGANSKRWIAGFYAATLSFLILSGIFSHQQSLFYALLLLITADFLYQLRTLNTQEPISCARAFKHNRLTGMLIFLACWL